MRRTSRTRKRTCIITTGVERQTSTLLKKSQKGTAESDSRAERPTGHRYAIRGWTETAEFVRGQGACLAVWATDNLE